MIKIKLPVLVVAKKLNVSAQSVYAWKRGEFLPKISKLKKLAKLEGVSVDKLLK